METFDLRQWNGFAATGLSTANPVLVDQIVVDSGRIDSLHCCFVALKGKKNDGHRYVRQAANNGAKYAIVSFDFQDNDLPSSLMLIRVKSPLGALQEIAKAYRLLLPVKVIGITGSFGKTMVKDLLLLFLRKQFNVVGSPESFNSQIGVPLSLLKIGKKDQFAIIEAAISHKEEIELLADLIQPSYSILTPIGKKHLASLKTEEGIFEELAKFIKATSSAGWALLPDERKLQLNCSSVFWNLSQNELPNIQIKQGTYEIIFPDGDRFENHSIKSAYFFNLLSISVKAAWLLGTTKENIIQVLSEYEPEPIRTEIWRSAKGTTFINTPYSSDPQSITRSLRYFDNIEEKNRKIVVFGGMKNDHKHSPIDYKCIGRSLSDSALRYLVLVGKQSFKELIDVVEAHSPQTEITLFNDYNDAFPYLLQHLKEEDFILFKGEKKITLDTLIEEFNDSSSHNQCTINLAAIHENLQLILSRLPEKTRVMVMVKALAYGTDDRRMAQFLADEEVDILGVSYVDEAVTLRGYGVKQSIFVLHVAPYECAKAVKWDLEIGVSNEEMIENIAQAALYQNKKIKLHLHVNTGMGRFGCDLSQVLHLAQLIESHASLQLEGIMTHFSCAEDPNEDLFTLEQARRFDEAIALLEKNRIFIKWKHAANSSAAIRFHFPQYNMVRLGLSIYGLYPSQAVMEKLDLRLALSLISRIVAISDHLEGDTISYGKKYQIKEKKQKIAVLPIGYFDGIHRSYSQSSTVLIRGQHAKMVGNICMDYMMVDVSGIPEVKVGDKVLIYGEDELGYYLSPEDLAQKGDSIIHELMTCLGPRIPRVFIHEESKHVR